MNKLPKPGEHVVWPAAPSEAEDFTLRPPARGLGRLRAAPGAEAMRRTVVDEQAAALAAARTANPAAGTLPVRKGCKVRNAEGRLGSVVYCDVGVQAWRCAQDGTLLYGHVVRWANTLICEWVPRAELVVQA